MLEVARETAENLGLADRLQTIAGNFHEVEIPPGDFDLAIIANVTHLLKPEANRELFRKARGALRESGRVAVIDVIPGQPAARSTSRSIRSAWRCELKTAGSIRPPSWRRCC